jgi:hypothetical protein
MDDENGKIVTVITGASSRKPLVANSSAMLTCLGERS